MQSVQIIEPASALFSNVCSYASDHGCNLPESLTHPFDRAVVLLENGWQIKGFCLLVREGDVEGYSPFCSSLFAEDEQGEQLLMRECINEAARQHLPTIYYTGDSPARDAFRFTPLERHFGRNGKLLLIYSRGTGF